MLEPRKIDKLFPPKNSAQTHGRHELHGFAGTAGDRGRKKTETPITDPREGALACEQITYHSKQPTTDHNNNSIEGIIDPCQLAVTCRVFRFFFCGCPQAPYSSISPRTSIGRFWGAGRRSVKMEGPQNRAGSTGISRTSLRW